MKRRPGCCSLCGGGGASGEESTGGMCWDCQGTGHPHLGPCGGFWLWWCRHAGAALKLLILWLVVAAVPLFVFLETAWVTYLYASVSGAWWFTWLTLDVLYLRRFRAEAWN